MRKSQWARSPHQFRRKKSILRNRYFWIFVLIVIAVGTLTNLLIFHATFQIQEIRVVGNQQVATAKIQNLVREQTRKKILFFDSESIFLIDAKKIGASLLTQFPQIGSADTKRDFPNQLEVSIRERVPVAVFLQEQNLFLVDEEGIAFKHASGTPLNIFTIQDQIFERDISLGDQVVEKEKLTQFLSIGSHLKEADLLLESVEVLSQERVNARVFVGWEIYFNLAQNLDWQLEKLTLVLENQISEEQRGELEYIDVRFGDKAYYRYRE